MQTKLTLRMDDELIALAKDHATRTGKSISQMVADYFRLLPESGAALPRGDAPLTESLRGVLRHADLDREDYRRYLEEKHR